MDMNLHDETLTFLDILYSAIRVYLMFAFTSYPIIVIIGNDDSKECCMNSWEEIANAGAPPREDQVPPLEEGENDYPAPRILLLWRMRT